MCLAAACGRGDGRAPATATQPLEPALALIYQSACASCHARAGTGAPLTGNARDWTERLAQGSEPMLIHAVDGYRGMPPLGGCGRCSEADLRALIAYMSGGAGVTP